MFPAIVTPFLDEKIASPAVDFESLESLIEWLIEADVSGLVVCGSTGESATMSVEERLSVIRRSLEIVRGRVPIIAGTGTNATQESLEITRRAKALGVDAALVVAPYYNKPSQEGLYEHFRVVSEQGGLPVIVYNIPGRSVVEIATSTFRRLSKLSGIVAVKQSVDSAAKLVELAEAVGDDMVILAGDDPITFAAMSVGGKGVISASGTVIPREMLAITSAGLRGDLAECLEAQKRALPYINALFLETNPVPAKAALKIMGKIAHDNVRLPLVPASENTRGELRKLFSDGKSARRDAREQKSPVI